MMPYAPCACEGSGYLEVIRVSGGRVVLYRVAPCPACCSDAPAVGGLDSRFSEPAAFSLSS
ncbi:MAG: hypothetical protein QXQ87_09450 [Halobacteria archaeon]